MPGTLGCPQLLPQQPRRRLTGPCPPPPPAFRAKLQWGVGWESSPQAQGSGGRCVPEQLGPEATQVTLGSDMWPSQRGA